MPTNEHTLVSTEPSLWDVFLVILMLVAADIKPDNILVNEHNGNARSGTIQLGDLGDSVPEDVDTNNGEHIISAPIYRAPEVMLNARWTVAVDIWSLGATVSSIISHR